MEMRSIRILAGLSMLVICLSACTSVSHATVVWNEDFEAGMTEWDTFAFENWHEGPVIAGNFSVVGGLLIVNDDDVNYARHDSTTNVGTWSFDMYIPDVPSGYFGVLFMSNGSRPIDLDTRMVGIGATTAGVDRFNFWWERGPGEVIIDICYTPQDSILGWHHIDVTRTSGGSFNVFFNGSFEYTTLTNDVVQSTCLECYAFNATGAMFDNIEVNDEVLPITSTPSPTPTPTPSPIPLELIAIGVGAVAVVVILGVVCARRR